ncbi:MAG TPA: hypothetical protein VJ483_09250 [Holophagaceae bacterium]|nr:hypothetical protein [Holophagaceae bacterium]
MPRTDLEILSQVRIATPCEVGWDTMEGDDRVRHCAQCDKLVYNLAKLTAAEAVALLRAPGGPPCIQLWRRADGTVLTADCPVGLRLVARRRGRLAMTAALALGLLGGSAWTMQRGLLCRFMDARLAQSQPLGGAPAVDPNACGRTGGEPMPLGGKPQMPTPAPKPRRRRRTDRSRRIPPPMLMGDASLESVMDPPKPLQGRVVPAAHAEQGRKQP